jgi:hypothetical protein
LPGNSSSEKSWAWPWGEVHVWREEGAAEWELRWLGLGFPWDVQAKLGILTRDLCGRAGSLSPFFFFFWQSWSLNSELMLARQTFYHLSHSAIPFLCLTFFFFNTTFLYLKEWYKLNNLSGCFGTTYKKRQR